MDLSSVVPSAGMVSLIFSGIIWLTIAGVAVWAISMFIRNKIKYKYYGEINKRRYWENDSPFSQTKHIEGKAGYFNSKKKGSVFRIKYGLLPWHIIELKKKPNPKYMVDNKVYYNQYDTGQLVQAKTKINWDLNQIEIQPVDSNLAEEIEFDIDRRNKVLNTNQNKTMIVGFTIMGLILMVGIVVFYFLSKA